VEYKGIMAPTAPAAKTEFDAPPIIEMQDNERQCKTRPTKDASITFRAPSHLDATLREIATREDRSLGYVVCRMLTESITSNGAWFDS